MHSISDLQAGSVPAAARAEQLSTRLGFFIAGFGVAAWAPLVPYVKARSAWSDGALGLFLLCLGLGSLVAMPWAGKLAGRFGCRRILVATTGLICVTLPVLATTSTLPLLVAALLLFGAAVGSFDCVVNIQAVIVERASGRPMMSGFHGLFSVGGIVGAGGVSALLSLGASPFLAVGCVVAVLTGVLIKAAPHWLAYAGAGTGSAFAVPKGVVLLIGALCFVVFLTEGAALDWSAVFLTSVRHVPPSSAGLAYAAFAGTMTIGRLTGDAIVRRFGRQRVIVGGALCAAAGLTLATWAPAWEACILGYAMVGIGCSNIVPVLYTAVGRQTVMPEHIAVPAITTLGYAGILAGPPVIGFLAHATSLSVALTGVAVLLLGVAVSGCMLRV